jgi:hypothetical protein
MQLNRKLTRIQKDGNSLFRALWTARTRTGRTAKLNEVWKMREEIAGSIVRDHTPFIAYFFLKNNHAGNNARTSMIRTIFRENSPAVMEFIECMKKLGREVQGQRNSERIARSKDLAACVALYAGVMGMGSVHGQHAWGGPIEIQAFANLMRRIVAVYEVFAENSPITIYIPQHTFPITILGDTSDDTETLVRLTKFEPRTWRTRLPHDAFGIVSDGTGHYDALMKSPSPPPKKRKNDSNNDMWKMAVNLDARGLL